jgi:hydroxypyruvate isomerase
MITFSANLGFLWTDRPLPDAIAAAATAGFDAVECHMPYVFAPDVVLEALTEADLQMVSLNTRIGDRDGDLGVAALPGREAEARDYIDEAIAYADAIGCDRISVVAGRSGRTDAAEQTYRTNLAYAAERAAEVNKVILIEPLNSNVAEDYHLLAVEAGVATIEAVGADNLKLMVDCFHTRTMQGDLENIFRQHLDHVGHIQISAYPDRGEPVGGDIDYRALLPAISAMGWDGPFGAEYTPRGDLDEGLVWLDEWREPAASPVSSPSADAPQQDGDQP